MAHFRATIHGNRGAASRLGTKKTGMQASVNGWNVRVSVDATHDEGTGQDTITVWVTGGSNRGPSPSNFVLQVKGKDGIDKITVNAPNPEELKR